MSWRLIFAVLLIAAGASAWGGLRLGDWLIAHGPAQPVMPAHPELEPVPVLGADGKPFVATAPQPLPDGRLGVPLQTPPVNWEIQTVPLMDSAPPIALATTTITMDEAIALASQNQQNGLEGIATVDTIQPVDITTAPPPRPRRDSRRPATGRRPSSRNWRCASKKGSFPGRPAPGPPATSTASPTTPGGGWTAAPPAIRATSAAWLTRPSGIADSSAGRPCRRARSGFPASRYVPRCR